MAELDVQAVGGSLAILGASQRTAIVALFPTAGGLPAKARPPVAVEFGVGRYPYRLPSPRVEHGPQRKQFKHTPRLPAA
jgi:hypothetical protein